MFSIWVQELPIVEWKTKKLHSLAGMLANNFGLNRSLFNHGFKTEAQCLHPNTHTVFLPPNTGLNNDGGQSQGNILHPRDCSWKETWKLFWQNGLVTLKLLKDDPVSLGWTSDAAAHIRQLRTHLCKISVGIPQEHPLGIFSRAMPPMQELCQKWPSV